MKMLTQSRLAFLVLSILLVALYAFGLLIGMYSLGETFWIAILMVVLGTLFAVYQWRVSRALKDHEHEDLAREVHRLREKRGF
jgi:membrane protein implicated in regulation of membrane protease activity